MNLNRIKDHTKSTFEEMAQVLRLDHETGTLMWRPESGRTGRASTKPTDATCYSHVRVNGFTYAAHRVVWLLAHGSWPRFVVDHINGDRHDNRPANLRDVTHAENQKNQNYHRRGERRPDYRTGLKLVRSAPAGQLTFTKFEAEMARMEADRA